MKKTLFGFLLCLFAINSYSGEGSGTGKITQLYMTANDSRVMVRFSLPIKNPDGCEGADYYIYEFPAGEGNKFYSTLLAAHMSKSDVSFYISGCTSSQHWGKTRPKLFDIYVN